MAGIMALEALLLAGRLDEAEAMIDAPGVSREFGSVTRATHGLMVGLHHLLSGRWGDAAATLEESAAAADRVSARPSGVAARAALAEALTRSGEGEKALQLLADLPSPLPGGLAGLLVDRARAVTGDESAAAALAADCERLAAPGLVLD